MAKHKANRTQDPRPLVVAWRSSGLSVEEYAFRSGLDTGALRALVASDASQGAGNVDGVASVRPVVVELDLASAGLGASADPRGWEQVFGNVSFVGSGFTRDGGLLGALPAASARPLLARRSEFEDAFS